MICKACGFRIWHTSTGAKCRCGTDDEPQAAALPANSQEAGDAPEVTSEAAAARKRAEAMLGPIWLERARTVLFSLALEGHPSRAAERRSERRTLDESSGLRRAALLETFARFPYWRQAVWGPLNLETVSKKKGRERKTKHASRSEFVRVLAETWKRPDGFHVSEIPGPFPGATAWAYFDLAMGWTDPARSAHASAWRSLVASWQAELRAVGLGTKTARKRPGAGS